jgi:hypothetical protein
MLFPLVLVKESSGKYRLILMSLKVKCAGIVTIVVYAHTMLSLEWVAKIQCKIKQGGLGKGVAINKGPSHADGIDWIYVIDLDNLLFSVDYTTSIRLDKIPRGPEHVEWIQYLRLDGSGDRCVHPSTPREILPSETPYVDHLLPEDSLQVYSESNPQILDPSRWFRSSDNRPVLNELSLFAFTAAIEECYGALRESSTFRPDLEIFQIPAKFLLSLAAPGIMRVTEGQGCTNSTFSSGASTPRREGLRHYLKMCDGGIQEESLNAFERSRQKRQDDDLPLCWRFRNCIVVLANRLDDPDYVKRWIGLAIKRARGRQTNVSDNSNGTEHTVLLWSMQYAVAVVISDAGVSHTPTMPIMDAFGRDDSAFVNGVDFLMHFLQPSFIHPVTTQGSVKSSDVQDPTKAGLPFDVVTRIIDYADVKTHNSFSVVSKLYRAYWARHPRVGRFKLVKGSSKAVGEDQFPHTVSAVDCADDTASTPQDMFLFCGQPDMRDDDDEDWDEQGHSIVLRLPFYDPEYFSRKHPIYRITRRSASASASGNRARIDYILPKNKFKRCPEKLAFRPESGEIPCKRNWPVEIN